MSYSDWIRGSAMTMRSARVKDRLDKLTRTAVVALTAMSGLACDSLLDVAANPQTVDASRTINIEEAVIGATVNLMFAYDEKISFGGLFGDEFVNSGTAPANQLYDQRLVPSNHGTGEGRDAGLGGGFYIPLQRTNTVSELHLERIMEGGFEGVTADSPQFALFSVYAGFAKLWLADLYCTVALRGVGPEYTATEVYQLAVDDFTRALGTAGITNDMRQAALVGRARVSLILGNDDAAVNDALQVDPDFELLLPYSTNTFAQRNRVHVHTFDVANWSTAPAFRGLTIDDTGVPDPRVDLAGPFPGNEPSQPVYAPAKVGTPSSPLRVATGDEARYILAEVSSGQVAVDIINEVRARYDIGQRWTPSGTGSNEIRDKVIDERRRTLFIDGVRLGDLRRYIDKYGLDFFSTSTPQGFPMGSQACLPLPDIERDTNEGI